ncbi:MAG: L-serine ammonia-lyase, iron-sulfur-dependent, subunit alpha [Desulfotignum sp.]|nr:L-serine ammonia-lyase, iron-sulfur-dependent, subunit alpha [Desulfotignum sp.]
MLNPAEYAYTQTYRAKDILKREVTPALGCTDPVAIALSAAAAARLVLPEPIEAISVRVDPNIFKNGFSVPIPGTSGLNGLDLSAALGAFGGDPDKGLEVLETLTPETLAKAVTLVKNGGVTIHLLHGHRGIHIQTHIRTADHESACVIENTHENIVSLTLDGVAVAGSPLVSESRPADRSDRSEFETWLRRLSLEEMLDMATTFDENDILFIKKGVMLNHRLAEYGLSHASGMGIGRTLQRLVEQGRIKQDMILSARILTAAAADARMAGASLPAMASAGSGNHGLTAVLPIWAIKNYVTCSDNTVYQAIGFSHILTSFVKSHTGRLSPLCGCSIAAGAGAAAGITWLMGGDVQQIAAAVKNLIGDLSGMVCDGAKPGCALKLSTASGNAVQAALLALEGVTLTNTDGILADTLEQTIQNLGIFSTRGMSEADATIIDIMVNKDKK